MDKPMIDELTQRFELLERENRRWKRIACATILLLTITFAFGGVVGSRSVEAQLPGKQAPDPSRGRFEYKVLDQLYLNQLEEPLQKLAADGWEIVQVVPINYTGLRETGRFDQGLVVARRPLKTVN
jgi:hypothetical protein